MKLIDPSNLFLPGAHHQDAPGRKRTKWKFHQEHIQKNHTLLKIWEIKKIIGPFAPVCTRMYVRYAAIIESRMSSCKSLVVELWLPCSLERFWNDANRKACFSAFERYKNWVGFVGLQWCQFESRVARSLDIMMAIPGKLLVNVRGPWNRWKMSDFQVFWV